MSLVLREVLSGLASELEALLRSDDESELASQIASLTVVDRCRCDVDSCATIFTVPKPEGAWGPTHRNIVLDVPEGMTVLDVLDEKIVCIEILDRDEITSQVLGIHRLPFEHEKIEES
jgi:hypothetical protein